MTDCTAVVPTNGSAADSSGPSPAQFAMMQSQWVTGSRYMCQYKTDNLFSLGNNSPTENEARLQPSHGECIYDLLIVLVFLPKAAKQTHANHLNGLAYEGTPCLPCLHPSGQGYEGTPIDTFTSLTAASAPHHANSLIGSYKKNGV